MLLLRSSLMQVSGAKEVDQGANRDTGGPHRLPLRHDISLASSSSSIRSLAFCLAPRRAESFVPLFVISLLLRSPMWHLLGT